jgi:hypothetical protein
MIRLMHPLASAKQAASGRPQLGNAPTPPPRRDCGSTDLVDVDAVCRSGRIPHPFAYDCTTNPAPTRYGRRMVQVSGTSRYLLAALSLAVKVRWPVWTTIGTLLAGTIPLLGVILEHFRTKQVDEKFDL